MSTAFFKRQCSEKQRFSFLSDKNVISCHETFQVIGFPSCPSHSCTSYLLVLVFCLLSRPDSVQFHKGWTERPLDTWDISMGQMGHVHGMVVIQICRGGVPPNFFMFLGFFFRMDFLEFLTKSLQSYAPHTKYKTPANPKIQP